MYHYYNMLELPGHINVSTTHYTICTHSTREMYFRKDIPDEVIKILFSAGKVKTKANK